MGLSSSGVAGPLGATAGFVESEFGALGFGAGEGLAVLAPADD